MPCSFDTAAAVPRSFDTAAAVPRSFDTAAAVPRSFDTAATVPRSFDTTAAVGSPFRCSRAAVPSGRSGSPPSFRVSWLIQHRTGLSLPVQQSHGSLRSQREPSICCSEFTRLIQHCPGLPLSGAAEPRLPSVAVRALHRFKSHGSFSIEQGSPFRCSRATAPSGRSGSPPSVVLSLQGSFSTAQGSPFRCSRAAAPFGRSESPPSFKASWLIQHRTGLSLLVQQSRSSLRSQ